MEHRDPGPDSDERPVSALRELLNIWDPIGVVGHSGPRDEYDCMIAPILDRLEAGAGPAELADFLRFELREHFGLNPDGRTAGIESVSRGAAGRRVSQSRGEA